MMIPSKSAQVFCVEREAGLIFNWQFTFFGYLIVFDKVYHAVELNNPEAMVVDSLIPPDSIIISEQEPK